MASPINKNSIIGIGLAIAAAIIWSGNFIIAKTAATTIPPVMLSFLRWFFATVLIAPFAWKKYQQERQIVWQHKSYFFFTAFAGFTCYNVLLYIAGHYTSAINLALIGSLSAPIFAVAIAAIFFKEHVPLLRIIGLLLCVIGIVILIAKGSWARLKAFHFEIGDLLSMVGGLSFAIYNNLAKHKPKGISSINFLFVGFCIGTTLLFPTMLIEHVIVQKPLPITLSVVGTIAYLSIGCSFVAYLFWNQSIHLIGPSRTVIFGNLIPIFSTIEAVILLGEPFTNIHLISGLIVLVGLMIANIPVKKRA
jgi:drug/metabolite transporter (DMT)-like permease